MMVLDGPAHQEPTARPLVGPPGYHFARKKSIKDRRASNTHLLVGRLLLPAELGAITSGMLEILKNAKHAD